MICGALLIFPLAEGRPEGAGLRLASELAAAGIPARVLLDLAVAYVMSEVDMVLVGAEVVTETGGVVGVVGTYQVALVARAMSRPVYVAAESYKFARLYPLGQKDIEQGAGRAVDFGGVPVAAGVDVEAVARDFTPPQHLELLVTDLGVLPPPAVGDVLLQLSL
jgi:translation initiation factor eIF-2B subunit alpha